MDVHARPVLSKEGLRHKRRTLADLPGRILDQILESHGIIRCLEESVELPVDLTLPGRPHLVVSTLNFQSGILHMNHDVVAKIIKVVGGSHREVPSLGRCLIPLVPSALLASCVP